MTHSNTWISNESTWKLKIICDNAQLHCVDEPSIVNACSFAFVFVFIWELCAHTHTHTVFDVWLLETRSIAEAKTIFKWIEWYNGWCYYYYYYYYYCRWLFYSCMTSSRIEFKKRTPNGIDVESTSGFPSTLQSSRILSWIRSHIFDVVSSFSFSWIAIRYYVLKRTAWIFPIDLSLC